MIEIEYRGPSVPVAPTQGSIPPNTFYTLGTLPSKNERLWYKIDDTHVVAISEDNEDHEILEMKPHSSLRATPVTICDVKIIVTRRA